MTQQDPYANLGPNYDPQQPQGQGGYPSSAGSAGYPAAGYPSAPNPYEGARQAPDVSQAYGYGVQPQEGGSPAYPPSPSYPQSAASAAPGPTGYPATVPGYAAAPVKPSPFGLLFDFGFSKVATPQLGKLLHVGTFAAGLLWYVGTVAGLFYSSMSALPYGGSTVNSFYMVVAVLFLLTGWVFPLVVTGLVRVFVEFATATVAAAHAVPGEPGQTDAA
ncbi:DUF4282 domain-containing protein [Propionicicella superfundia]|uniref:DUF4282 domain-containing protein n=1 Tax=Propionicicella superfundia TaxID=348582 RepID=UPI000422716A|nr:DUF4282 domain-containing protein [Propionicicella superfundia]